MMDFFFCIEKVKKRIEVKSSVEYGSKLFCKSRFKIME